MESKKREIYFYSRSKGRVDIKYRFLSNFFKASFILDNKKYATVEHYYQSKKHSGTDLEEKIRVALTPKEAKKIAWQRDPQSDWVKRKENVMLKALRAKFNQNPSLNHKLLKTGDSNLHEDSPSDMYWGVKGNDRLGKLLMLVRDELRTER